MLAAGCAVGLGNVWRFPFVTGQNGGAAFVLVYLVFLALLGFPMLTAELALGRGAKKGIAGAFAALAPSRLTKVWGFWGTLIFAGNFILMIYYTDVAGWLVKYAGSYATGNGIADDPGAAFGALLGDRATCSMYMLAAVGLATAVCLAGVVKGVERVTKFMMLSLLSLLVVLAVKAVSLPGAVEGLKFYLAPDWAKFMEHPWKAVFDAMGQAFFTLSIGVGAMTIFGSYIGKEHSLVKESALIIVIDTMVALLAGLIIFPACAAYGVEYTAGQGLIFVALPKVFQAMPSGRVWGFFFFLFLSFAALTTIIGVFECLIGGLMDEAKWPRRRAALTVGLSVAVLSMPAVLGYSVWKDVLPWAGKTVLDVEDFILSQFWLPLGALVTCLYCTQPFGVDWTGFRNEASAGAGWRLPSAVRPYMRWILPFVLLTVLIGGL